MEGKKNSKLYKKENDIIEKIKELYLINDIDEEHLDEHYNNVFSIEYNNVQTIYNYINYKKNQKN